MKKIISLVTVVFMSSVASAEIKSSTSKQSTQSNRGADTYYVKVLSSSTRDDLSKWQSALAAKYLSRKAARRDGATLNAKKARKKHLKQFNADFAITKFTHARGHRGDKVICHYQMTVSDRRGKILTMFSGKAQLNVASTTLAHEIPDAWQDVLAGAANAAEKDLSTFIRSKTRPVLASRR